MSIAQGPALTAIAFQLAAALDAYEVEVEGLLSHSNDLELYRKVSARMDEMRLYASALPHVAVPWVEVLIRHFELTHGLWQVYQAKMGVDELAEVRRLHRGAVGTLQQRLLQSLPSQ